jgi:hypothetical protein
MKKLIIISTLLTGFSLSINPVQANLQKCTPGYVVPLLHKGIVQENGDFLIPEPGGRTYGMYINGNIVKRKDLDAQKHQAIANAQVANVITHWNSAADPAQESCSVTIKTLSGRTTEVTLFPYAYVQKK